MGLAISGLNAVETPATTDVLEVEQSTGSAKATIQQIDDLVFNDTLDLDATILPIEGDLATYDGSAWEPNAEPRWRVIPSSAWTTTVSTSDANRTITITFNGGEVTDGVYLKASDYFEAGVAVRVTTNSDTYYGVCVSATDTDLTLHVAAISGTVSGVAVGTKDMVKTIRLVAKGTGYDGGGVTYVAKGCQHRWSGPPGRLVLIEYSHMTSASNLPSLVLHNGNSTATLNDTATEIPAGASASVYGAWVKGWWIYAGNDEMTEGSVLRIVVSVAGGTPSDYLICSILVVVP